MRPRSDVRSLVTAALVEAGPAYPLQLSHRLELDVCAVRSTLSNMCRAGEVMVLRDERLPGSNRPARVYGLIDAGTGEREKDPLDWSLIDCWSSWPVDA